MTNRNYTLGGGILKVSRLQQTLPIASSLWTSNPHRLLGVIDLLLVSSLHLNGREQELCGIRVHSALHQLDMARHGELVCNPLVGNHESKNEID